MNWDEYFLGICNSVAQNSKCLSRKIGAIVVTDDHSIVSTGYNGPPRGVSMCGERWKKDDYVKEKIELFMNASLTHEIKNPETIKYLSTTCPRYVLQYKSGEGLELCIAGHGERNALINAARHGIKCKGRIMYMNCTIPCAPCLVEIINAGINEIVCTELKYYDEASKFLIHDSKIKVRIFNFKEKKKEIPKGTIIKTMKEMVKVDIC
jgi:dCMP deaminase